MYYCNVSRVGSDLDIDCLLCKWCKKSDSDNLTVGFARLGLFPILFSITTFQMHNCYAYCSNFPEVICIISITHNYEKTRIPFEETDHCKAKYLQITISSIAFNYSY